MPIRYHRASTDDELSQILALQKRNAPAKLTPEEIADEGFITVSHSFDILKRMNAVCPHIIAKDGNRVVGYALAMATSFRNEIAVLASMFTMIDALFEDHNYMVMGQVCIDKSYRKKGVFRGLYSFYKEELKDSYDGLITQVATSNLRSLSAHISIGFTVEKRHVQQNVSWELIRWRWR